MGKKKHDVKEEKPHKMDSFTVASTFSSLNMVVGVIVMIYVGNKWSNYLQLLHENQFFFTGIKVGELYILWCILTLSIQNYESRLSISIS